MSASVHFSGTVNPRKLVQAQQTIALKNGCTIMKDIVHSVDEHGQELLCVKTDAGKTVLAKKVMKTIPR